MNQLSYPKKLALLSMLGILAISALSFALYTQFNKEIEESTLQLQGIEKIVAINNVVQLIQEHRGLSSTMNIADKAMLPAYTLKTQQTEVALYQLTHSFNTSARFKEEAGRFNGLKQQWKTMVDDRALNSAERDFAEHTHLIQKLSLLLTLVGDHYLLITDNELTSYYLIDSILNILPNITEHLGQIRATATGVLATGELTRKQHEHLLVLNGLTKQSITELEQSITEIKRHSPQLATRLDEFYTSLVNNTDYVTTFVEQEILQRQLAAKANEFFIEITANIDNIYQLTRQRLVPSLRLHIQSRLTNDQNTLIQILGLGLFILFTILYLMVGLYKSVVGNIQHISQAVNAYSQGNLDARINLHTFDEMRQISASVNAMADNTNKARGRIEMANAYSSTRADISSALQLQHPIKERFEMVLKLLAEFGQSAMQNKLVVFLMPKDKKELTAFAMHGAFSDQFIPDYKGVNLADLFCHEVTINAGIDPSENSINREIASHYYSVPIKVAGNILGVLLVYTTSEPTKTSARLEFLSYIGYMLGLAFSNDLAHQQLSEEKKIAENANKAKSEFLANISHELRTPIHAILSFSGFGIKRIDTAPKDKLAQYFTNIQSSGGRLLSLINDLLDLSKLEAGKIVLSEAENNLATVLENCRREQEQIMADNDLTLQINIPKTPLIATFDAIQIGQVITNFLSNAIKFSPPNSSLIATICETSNKELSFSLKDAGIGIPESELTDIFDAFIQSSKTNTGSGGTGLGLAISKNIIEAHGGKVWAENNPDSGATFTFVIPLF